MAKNIKKSDLDKPWNRRPVKTKAYVMGSKAVNDKRFLIVCEGKNTEPSYFESFPVVTAAIETIGAGRSKTSLVNHVIQLVNCRTSDKSEEVWIVFDMDCGDPVMARRAQEHDFNEAVSLAKAKGFKVAYSNDSFELWFVLHHHLLESALTREEYYNQISRYWKISYEREGKGKAFCRTVYQRLLPLQSAAIRHAQQLHERHMGHPPATQNPCTTVYELVVELNKYLKK
jgi:predicted GIY-YIG superfamily endonuclease